VPGAARAGTAGLNVPMFIALRRFTLLCTIVLERVMMAKRHDPSTLGAVAIMIGGASLVTAGRALGLVTWPGCIAQQSLCTMCALGRNRVCAGCQGCSSRTGWHVLRHERQGVLLH